MMLFPSAETAMHLPNFSFPQERPMNTSNTARYPLPSFSRAIALEKVRLFRWPQRRRPDNHPGLSEPGFLKNLKNSNSN